MNPFTGIIDEYAQVIRPHVQAVGVTAQAYAERVIARLDDIANAVQPDDFSEERTILAVTIPDGAVRGIGTVPRGSEWILENIAVEGADAAIAVATEIRVTADDRLRFIKVITTDDTVQGSGVWFSESSEIQLSHTGATPVRIVAQFRQKRTAKATRRAGGGTPNPVPDGSGARTDTSRHAMLPTGR